MELDEKETKDTKSESEEEIVYRCRAIGRDGRE
jgi:hypothetical protein